MSSDDINVDINTTGDENKKILDDIRNKAFKLAEEVGIKHLFANVESEDKLIKFYLKARNGDNEGEEVIKEKPGLLGYFNSDDGFFYNLEEFKEYFKFTFTEIHED